MILHVGGSTLLHSHMRLKRFVLQRNSNKNSQNMGLIIPENEE